MIRKKKTQYLYNQIKKTVEHQICPMNEKVFIYDFWGMLPLPNIKEAIKKKRCCLLSLNLLTDLCLNSELLFFIFQVNDYRDRMRSFFNFPVLDNSVIIGLFPSSSGILIQLQFLLV